MSNMHCFNSLSFQELRKGSSLVLFLEGLALLPFQALVFIPKTKPHVQSATVSFIPTTILMCGSINNWNTVEKK